MYPEKADLLINKWPQFKSHIIAIYKGSLKKKEHILFINKLEDEKVPELTKDFLVLYLYWHNI